VSGTVKVSGGVIDRHSGCGDGIDWSVDKAERCSPLARSPMGAARRSLPVRVATSSTVSRSRAAILCTSSSGREPTATIRATRPASRSPFSIHWRAARPDPDHAGRLRRAIGMGPGGGVYGHRRRRERRGADGRSSVQGRWRRRSDARSAGRARYRGVSGVGREFVRKTGVSAGKREVHTQPGQVQATAASGLPLSMRCSSDAGADRAPGARLHLVRGGRESGGRGDTRSSRIAAAVPCKARLPR
jgi:hypothetical protein